jgi:surface protein
MFDRCTGLATVPLFDTSKVTSMNKMFYYCKSLTSVPLFDTSNVTSMESAFYECDALTTVPELDMRKVTGSNGFYQTFYKCTSLTDIRIKNISHNLQVASGTSYGHLLTVDSLVHLIYELRQQSSSRTLTIGAANLEKLANVYVKLIDITDEMRAEDDLIDEKLPFEVCESTDEGAQLITTYVSAKNWALK